MHTENILLKVEVSWYPSYASLQAVVTVRLPTGTCRCWSCHVVGKVGYKFLVRPTCCDPYKNHSLLWNFLHPEMRENLPVLSCKPTQLVLRPSLPDCRTAMHSTP